MAARFSEMIQSAEAENWGYRSLLLRLCEAEGADRFDAVILDDLGYVQQSREEIEVLFTFLAER